MAPWNWDRRPAAEEERELAIIRGFFAVLHDLRVGMARDEIWRRVYVLVPCTEAEFSSAMESFRRVAAASGWGARKLDATRKRAHLSIVK